METLADHMCNLTGSAARASDLMELCGFGQDFMHFGSLKFSRAYDFSHYSFKEGEKVVISSHTYVGKEMYLSETGVLLTLSGSGKFLKMAMSGEDWSCTILYDGSYASVVYNQSPEEQGRGICRHTNDTSEELFKAMPRTDVLREVEDVPAHLRQYVETEGRYAQLMGILFRGRDQSLETFALRNLNIRSLSYRRILSAIEENVHLYIHFGDEIKALGFAPGINGKLFLHWLTESGSLCKIYQRRNLLIERLISKGETFVEYLSDKNGPICAVVERYKEEVEWIDDDENKTFTLASHSFTGFRDGSFFHLVEEERTSYHYNEAARLALLRRADVAVSGEFSVEDALEWISFLEQILGVELTYHRKTLEASEVMVRTFTEHQ